jgi:hypothetical protein
VAIRSGSAVRDRQSAQVIGWLAALVMVAGAAGCGGGSDGKKAPKKRPGPQTAGQPRFSGGPIAGTLYLLAGPNQYSTDVYRARGNLASVDRLTTTVPGLSVSWITAQDDHVVVADARQGGTDQIEALHLARVPALPGEVIDSRGQSPALSSTGMLAYVVPQYAPDGGSAGTAVMVSDATGAGKHVVYRSRADLAPTAWLPGGRLAVLERPEVRARLIIDPGRGDQRTIDPGVPEAFVMQANAAGAFVVAGRSGRLAIVSATGRRKLIHSPWFALCWSPDGGSILVSRGSEVGLMSPQDGSVRPLGRTDPSTTAIGGAAWVA